MSRKYYALISSLPELSLNDKTLSYDLVSYRNMLADEVHPSDFPFISLLYYKYDIINFVNLALNESDAWDAAGILSREELEEGLKMPELLPPFFQDFMDSVENGWRELPKKQIINQLTIHYLDWAGSIDNDFVKSWVRFQQNLKNLLIWHNAKKFDKDPKEEVLGNNYEAEYLRSVDRGDLNLKAWDFAYKEALVILDNPNIALREARIDKMRWDFLGELEQDYYFEKERLMAFAIRLQIINRNIITTEEKGREKLTDLLADIKEGYTMPEIFT